MEKRQRSLSLSFVLFRFAAVMLGSMLLCCVLWYAAVAYFRNAGITCRGSVSNLQAEQMLAGEPKAFVSPGKDFLAEYALFGPGGEVLESNVKGKKRKDLARFFQEGSSDIHVMRHTYEDGKTVVLRWHYRAEFVSPVLRGMLPPAEYLGLAALSASLALCVLVNTIRLRRLLADKLKLFGEASAKIGAQELDFTIPGAGIREYDEALQAMEQMRDALYRSLSSQWAAQREREAEIAALAHDLKTPLTLVGGNAELLLEEELTESSRRMVQTIAAGSDRAKQYVACLLDSCAGAEEAFAETGLPAFFDELCRNMSAVAQTYGVRLVTCGCLEGDADIQKERLLRALGNVVINAIEYTPAGGNVYVEGGMADSGWQIIVLDEGPGFSKAAIRHAQERLWRGDEARGADGHNGLGLWFAAQVAAAHEGQLELQNCGSGAMVIMKLPHS